MRRIGGSVLLWKKKTCHQKSACDLNLPVSNSEFTPENDGLDYWNTHFLLAYASKHETSGGMTPKT